MPEKEAKNYRAKYEKAKSAIHKLRREKRKLQRDLEDAQDKLSQWKRFSDMFDNFRSGKRTTSQEMIAQLCTELPQSSDDEQQEEDKRVTFEEGGEGGEKEGEGEKKEGEGEEEETKAAE